MGETVRGANESCEAVKDLEVGRSGGLFKGMNPSPFKVIMKPVDSAGSDGVTLCQSMEECQKAFGDIIGKTNVLGLVNEQLLVQEYLEGIEYVVDMVSREGEHKCVAIWEYDRRSANGAGFVAFGQRLLTMDEPRAQELVAYQKKVLTALSINFGPSHGEVKWHQGEPVLVEVGSRCHGAEGFWMPVSDSVYGYNHVECAIDSAESAAAFSKVPENPQAPVVGLPALLRDVQGRHLPGREQGLDGGDHLHEELPAVRDILHSGGGREKDHRLHLLGRGGQPGARR